MITLTDNNIEKLTQAVILAGGRGERLRPLTDTLPKPMIPFHGKPFLEYLVELLREQGFKKILLLTGYMSGVIQDYFGDGSSFGIEIDYSVSDVENDTSKRIKLAEEKIDSYFLLMYCDNYWPMRMREMWKHFLAAGVLAQITVYTNRDNYTKNNVLVDNKDIVVCYDKNRLLSNLNGVEIGFVLMKKEILNLLSDENINFEKEIFPLLAENHQLSAYLTDHRYYSIGSHERLSLTDSFLKRMPAVILDRDGVLNQKAPQAEYIKSSKTPNGVRSCKIT
jgi:D-glycero-D-manno-heptose 1,7-bisphosphate phosphatase